jgi:hypothetical protein
MVHDSSFRGRRAQELDPLRAAGAAKGFRAKAALKRENTLTRQQFERETSSQWDCGLGTGVWVARSGADKDGRCETVGRCNPRWKEGIAGVCGLAIREGPGYSQIEMGFAGAKRGGRTSWVSILGMVCIALVLLTGIVHVAHSHANGQIDQDCALCVTAHQAVQVTAVVAVILSSQPVVRRVMVRVDPAPRQRFVLKLANRPPPVPVFA